MKFKYLLFSILILLTFCSSVRAQKTIRIADSIYSYRAPSKRGSGKMYMGREIADSPNSPAFGKKAIKFYEGAKRNINIAVTQAVDSLPLNDNAVVADVGAGAGVYTLLISKKVLNGKVYAVDIQDFFLNHIKKRAQQFNLNNILVVKGDETSPNLPDNSLDLALMSNVYHELSFPHEYLQCLRNVLKPNGILVMLEYRREENKKNDSEPLHAMTLIQITKELGANGFQLTADKEFLPFQHFLIFKRN